MKRAIILFATLSLFCLCQKPDNRQTGPVEVSVSTGEAILSWPEAKVFGTISAKDGEELSWNSIDPYSTGILISDQEITLDGLIANGVPYGFQYDEFHDFQSTFEFYNYITDLKYWPTYSYVAFAYDRSKGEVIYGEVRSFSTADFLFVPGEAVDLGLSVKWSSLNLGAVQLRTNQRTCWNNYGAFFAWGETEPKKDYNWETYKFGTSKDGPFSKYNNEYNALDVVDNKTILDPEDDAARVKLGGKWRMPTWEEFLELTHNCTIENVNPKFCKATSNIPGFTDQYIYLPNGYYRSTSESFIQIGESGQMWRWIPYSWDIFNRATGFFIRPVTD